MAIATAPMREGAELVGESGTLYLTVKPMGQNNVWIAVDAATQEQIFIVKQPSGDDVAAGWPKFQHEMIMHELFKGHPSIRQQVDRIPPSSAGDPPRLILEILETTLWEARRKREFSDVEVKEIMRSALVGLKEVHDKGLVYADLKMENILVSGFERKPNENDTIQNNNITAKLGDLGIVMEPMKGLVQPIAYRAPEVYFRREISPAIDIWSWGIIYCQLLEAQASFHKTGLYDELLQGSYLHKEESMQKAIVNDFGLNSIDYYENYTSRYRDHGHREGQHWDHLIKKGLPEKEVEFLRWVLNPVPSERPTAQQILDSGWLTPDKDEGGGILNALARRVMNVRKRSEPSLWTKYYDTSAKKAREEPVQQQAPVQHQSQPPVQAPAPYQASTRHAPPAQAPLQYQDQAQGHAQTQPPAEAAPSVLPPYQYQYQPPGQAQAQIQATAQPPAPKPHAESQPLMFDTQTAALAREDRHPARPATPRASTTGRPPGGGMFLNFGAVIR